MFLLSIDGNSQSLRYPNKPFQLMFVNGKLELGGGYRYQEENTNKIYNIRKSPVFYGGISVNTSSYIINPDVMVLDLGGEFNPEISRDDQLVIPDRSEARTFKRLNAGVSLLRNKSISLRGNTNYFEGFINRENLTNIKTKSFGFGGSLRWINSYIPVRINYDQRWSELVETESNRIDSNFHRNLQVNLTGSLSNRDQNEFTYFHKDNRRVDNLLNDTRNISDNFNLSNTVYLNRDQNYLFRSLITGTDQVGSDPYRKIIVFEHISLKFPAHLMLNGNYTYSNNTRESQAIKQQYIRSILKHELFKSLTTSFIFEFNNIKQSSYLERRIKFGINIKYNKKIARSGRILLGGEYYNQPLKRQSETELLQIFDEEHLLKDGELELLNKPHVISNSVLVKDPTGTIVYQEYLDYILIEQNVYLEIQRVPGGQIPMNSVVLIDYIVRQEGSYQYHINYLRFDGRIILFNRLLEMYYSRIQQHYSNLVNTDGVTLNYFTQNIFGLKFEYLFASLGIEYDNYNSTITPFTLWRYSLQLQGNAKGKFGYSLNVNYLDYFMRYNNTYQKYANIMGNLAYPISPSVKLRIELGYRKQIGEGIDLDLLSSRIELNLNYRKLFLRAGLELYKRIYIGEQLDYYNVYVKLVRTFDWNKR